MIGCNILGMSIWIPFGVLNLDIDSIDTRGGGLDACWKTVVRMDGCCEMISSFWVAIWMIWD